MRKLDQTFLLIPISRNVLIKFFSASNSLFTPPTRIRQNCLVLSVSAVWTQLETRQDSFVLSRPNFQFATVQSQIYWGLLKTWKLATGSRQDKTVLSCLQLCSHRRHGQDKTDMSASAVWTSYHIYTMYVICCWTSGCLILISFFSFLD